MPSSPVSSFRRPKDQLGGLPGFIDRMTGIPDIIFLVSDTRKASSRKGNLRLKVARTAAELTQAELASIVGVSRQTISMIEAGTHNPTLQLCIAICKALGTDLNALFWEEEK